MLIATSNSGVLRRPFESAEYAYDRQSHFGKLDVALDAAAANRWTVVDMKKDWKKIFAFD
jgi:hypothetical protein